MHRILIVVVTCFVVPAITVSAATPGSWHQWRGPLGTGVSPDATPPDVWNQTENVRWKTSIPGRGHSTPIISGRHVFLTTAVETGDPLPPRMSGRPGAHDNLPIDHLHEFLVVAIDRDDGSVLWQRKVHEAVPHEGGHRSASLASASPITDGRHVYAFFGSYGLYCLDFEGTLVWEKQFGEMHSKHGHGEGSSPALHDGLLFVNWDHEEQSFLVALDASTGEEAWRKQRDEVTSWSTPIIVDVDGAPQLVVCGTDRVRGYDPVSGEVIWTCGGMSANIVATPVARDGILYVGSSYEKRALLAIDLVGARGDLTGTERVLWQRSRGTPYVPSPLLYGDALYFLNHYQNVMTRVEAKSGVDRPGAMRLGPLGNIYASPVGAADKVYVTDLRGTTMVISHSEIPRLISVNQLGEPVSASLALVDSELFIRGEKHLYCIAAGLGGR